MTWPFENDTSAITKKIAKNDIDKNRVKKIFSLTTIVFATALLMMLIMFESGYETTKDRMAEGQPQVVFYDLSQQQIELLYSEENIESIKVTETENGYDASITIVDATKMTQYGFSSAVDMFAVLSCAAVSPLPTYQRPLLLQPKSIVLPGYKVV